MKPHGEGFLLLGPNKAPLFVNDDAIEILAYPKRRESIRSLDSFLAERIRSILSIENGALESGCITHVQSGRRRYLCRVLPLNGTPNGSKHHLGMAVLIERCSKFGLDARSWSARFHLTQREVETVAFLLQGLTNKEIASRMGISPNTVKAFIRLIMVKMAVSTRSGIIGKLLESVPTTSNGS